MEKIANFSFLKYPKTATVFFFVSQKRHIINRFLPLDNSPLGENS